MFTFALQLRDSLLYGQRYLFVVYVTLVWILWCWKVVLSARYKPFDNGYETTTSVVIPVVDEPLDLFRTVLIRIVDQQPDEVIVVINGKRNEALEAVCDEIRDVTWVWTETPGKRNAIRVGVERACGEIVLLVDSDTLWTQGVLKELIKPFAYDEVGGVTTQQRIIDPGRNLLTRWADWLESLRAMYAMPAQSVLGTIGCLPGRTIAFRKSILENCMSQFLSERFLGVFLEVSDDRTLTNYTLKQGYKTVYQSTSIVYTDAPTNLRKLIKQQLRWARGSQYNTMRMMPWMLRHARTLAVFFTADILLPFLLLGCVLGWLYRLAVGSHVDLYSPLLLQRGPALGVAQIVLLTVAGSVASFSIRQSRHLLHNPSDFLRLPLFIALCTVLLMPIRMIGFCRMAHASGWGTRANAYNGELRSAYNIWASLPYIGAFLLITGGIAYHA